MSDEQEHRAAALEAQSVEGMSIWEEDGGELDDTWGDIRQAAGRVIGTHGNTPVRRIDGSGWKVYRAGRYVRIELDDVWE